MLVLDYLKHNSLEKLREDHGVRYHVKGHLVTLAYDQFEGSMNDKIACMCRGMVLTSIGNMNVIDPSVPFNAKILAFPFVRFFNYGQVNTVFAIDRVYEKLDGTMIVMYFDTHSNEWRIGTRNVPDGSNFSGTSGLTFKELVVSAIRDDYNSSWQDFTGALSKGWTYVFELTSPHNRVVVQHNSNKLTLIGARDQNWVEQDIIEVAAKCSLHIPPIHKISDNSDPKEVLELLSKLANLRDPLVNEGFVIVGKNWERFKIKSDNYVSFNKVQDLTDYDIINLILKGIIDDYIPMMLQHQKDRAFVLSEKISAWTRKTNSELRALKASQDGLQNRKDFAAYIQNNENLNNVGKEIFRAYGENRVIVESIDLLKPWMDATSGHYQSSFLRKFMGWIS